MWFACVLLVEAVYNRRFPAQSQLYWGSVRGLWWWRCAAAPAASLSMQQRGWFCSRVRPLSCWFLRSHMHPPTPMGSTHPKSPQLAIDCALSPLLQASCLVAGVGMLHSAAGAPPWTGPWSDCALFPLACFDAGQACCTRLLALHCALFPLACFNADQACCTRLLLAAHRANTHVHMLAHRREWMVRRGCLSVAGCCVFAPDSTMSPCSCSTCVRCSL